MIGHSGWVKFWELQLPKRMRDGRRFILLVEVEVLLHVKEAEDSAPARTCLQSSLRFDDDSLACHDFSQEDATVGGPGLK